MGRFSSVQICEFPFRTFNYLFLILFLTDSDSHAKIEPVSAPQEDPSAKSKRLVVEKVDNVMGSCAGAGSGEFHVYRNARRREFARLEEIDDEETTKLEQERFESKVIQNKIEAEQRTLKKSAKRKAKREKVKYAKKQKDHVHEDAHHVESSSFETEEEKSDQIASDSTI